MNIVTHAMMGTVVASPFLATAPEAAAAFMFGSVLAADGTVQNLVFHV